MKVTITVKGNDFQDLYEIAQLVADFAADNEEVDFTTKEMAKKDYDAIYEYDEEEEEEEDDDFDYPAQVRHDYITGILGR